MTTTQLSTVIAFDPGLNGAWALLAFNGDFLEAGDLPRWENMLNGIEIAKLLWQLNPKQAVIERVHSMPKQGVASAFTFGAAYGMLIGLSCSNSLPIAYVTPQKWKSHFRLAGRNKEHSVQRAIQIYPGAADFLTLKKHHGRADAILLARYWVDLVTRGEFV